MISCLGPHWSAQAFGSFANGFATLDSDLDVTCCMENLRSGDIQNQARSDLKLRILPLILEHPKFALVEDVLGARIPILKLRFERMLDVDISCHNPQPLCNSWLLWDYSRLDSRVKALGVAVKLWAKRAGICDATKANLSSYGLILMVVYFLQVDMHLPCLPVDASHRASLMSETIKQTKNFWQHGMSLRQMLGRFFAFYADKDHRSFQWGHEVVSVRFGPRHTAHESCFSELRGRYVERLHIEDPYQTERNLHCVLGEAEEEQLRSRFREACDDMHSDRVPRGMLPTHVEDQQSTKRDTALMQLMPIPSHAQQQHDAVNNGSPKLVSVHKMRSRVRLRDRLRLY
jgi:DNA polymerase sigma